MTLPAGATLNAALEYAAKGYRVIPIGPRKVPTIKAWQNLGTTDTDTITAWWTTEFPDAGVGIVTGHESGIFALDIDMKPDEGKRGDETLRTLEAQHGELPDTLTQITGGGGLHHIFRWSDDVEVRNSASGALGPDLDVRGEGGFIVAAPSIHPNGRMYAWDLGMPDEPVDAPTWLLEFLKPKPQVEPTRALRIVTDDESPGHLFANANTWTDLLVPDGWTLSHVDRQNESHWVRPGKTAREGTSATTGYTGNDNLKVFTSSLRHWGLEPEGVYTKFGYYAATRHGGDHTAAARALAEQGYTTRNEVEVLLPPPPPPVDPEEIVEPIGGWEFVDLDEILTGDYVAPVPTLGRRSDGLGLIYAGRVHSIAGEPGGGKTWLALHIIAEVIADGGTGALIDYEDTPSACVHRLRLLGLTNTQIRDQFHYVRPDGPLVTKGGKVDTGTLARLEGLEVDVVVIDSVGESLAVEGLPPNDDDAVTQWFRRLPRMLARRGAAVIGLDHVTKSKDDRGLWAIGSQRKLAAIDGAAYGVDVKVAPTKTKDGKLTVTCAKDRHGTYQRSHIVAHVAIDNVDTGVRVLVTAPANKFRPTGFMEKVSRFLEQIPCASGRGIEAAVPGKSEHIRLALECLVDEKYVAVEVTKRGNQYTSLTAFRDNAEIEVLPEQAPRPTASHRVPETRDAVQEALPGDRVPRVPDPLRSRGPAGTRSEDLEDEGTLDLDRDRVPGPESSLPPTGTDGILEGGIF